MPVMQSAPGAFTVIDGRRYLYFAGTGYLGLQGHPEVIRAACAAAEQFGIGSANSRTAFGTTPPVLDVERRAAELFGTDDAFYFASGYLGNHVLVRLLDGAFDAVFVDEFAHYCVVEAAQLSGRPVVRFRHNDAADLGARLSAELRPRERPLVATDGVFAARGDVAPLADYCRVLAQYPGAILLVDDAHALGVLGANGRGTLEHLGLLAPTVNADIAQPPLPCPAPSTDCASLRVFFCGTLSKALGGFGGIIPGSRAMVDRLRATSPYYAGASAVPTPAAAASARALEIVLAQPELRTRLWDNARTLKRGLARLGLAVDDTPVPIVCLALGNAANMRRIQRALMERGIAVAYMAAYAGLGPEGALRLAVFATHTTEMIQQLVDELEKEVQT